MLLWTALYFEPIRKALTLTRAVHKSIMLLSLLITASIEDCLNIQDKVRKKKNNYNGLRDKPTGHTFV